MTADWYLIAEQRQERINELLEHRTEALQAFEVVVEKYAKFREEAADIRTACWIRQQRTGDEFLDGIVMRLDALLLGGEPS